MVESKVFEKVDTWDFLTVVPSVDDLAAWWAAWWGFSRVGLWVGEWAVSSAVSWVDSLVVLKAVPWVVW